MRKILETIALLIVLFLLFVVVGLVGGCAPVPKHIKALEACMENEAEVIDFNLRRIHGEVGYQCIPGVGATPKQGA